MTSVDLRRPSSSPQTLKNGVNVCDVHAHKRGLASDCCCERGKEGRSRAILVIVVDCDYRRRLVTHGGSLGSACVSSVTCHGLACGFLDPLGSAGSSSRRRLCVCLVPRLSRCQIISIALCGPWDSGRGLLLPSR